MNVTRSSGPIRVVCSVPMVPEDNVMKMKVKKTATPGKFHQAKTLPSKVKPSGKPVGIPKMRKGKAKSK